MQPDNENPNKPRTAIDVVPPTTSSPLDSNTNQPVSTTPPSTPLRTAYNPQSPAPGKRSKLKLAAIIAAGLALVAGASAGAYYGIYLPNTPENVLKKSVANALTEKQTTGKGAAKYSADGNTAIVNYSIQQDTDKNVSSGNFDVAISGAKLPLEFRTIDKSLFIKVGDLGSIQGLANLYAPGSGDLVSQVSNQISNQWIEIDESLIKSTFKDDKCNPFGSAEAYRFTDKDVEQILNVYDKNSFVVIKNTSKDTVDNRSVTKMELDIDKDKAKAFGKDFEGVDYVKRLKECDDSKVSDSLTGENEEYKGTYSLTVWVDKSKKELVKVALNTKDDEAELELDFTFTGEQVDVQKPEGAKPLMQVLGELGPLFSGLLGAGAGQPDPAASGGTVDPSSLQNLEGYTNQY